MLASKRDVVVAFFLKNPCRPFGSRYHERWLSRSSSMAILQGEDLADRETRQFGRDELNICEFPVSLLTDRSPPDGTLTVKYQDRILDQASGRTVNRTV